MLNLQHWADFLNVLHRAGYRSRAMITPQLAVVYTYALYLIGRLDFGVEARRPREVMARWFFMATLTGRYSSSPEATFEADLARLREVGDAAGFVTLLDRVIATVLTEDYWSITLADELATTAARSPSLFGYYAALNLLDARVLFSDIRVADPLDPSVRGRRAPAERHHLCPRAYLAGTGTEDRREVGQIANYALVEWHDNAVIADQDPRAYWSVFAPSDAGSRERMAYWHALPDGWPDMAYGEFIAARRLLIARIIRDRFGTSKLPVLADAPVQPDSNTTVPASIDADRHGRTA